MANQASHSHLFWLVEGSALRASEAKPGTPAAALPSAPPDALRAFAQAGRRYQEQSKKIVFSHARRQGNALSFRALVAFEDAKKIIDSAQITNADWRRAEAGDPPASVLRAWAMILEKARGEQAEMRLAA